MAVIKAVFSFDFQKFFNVYLERSLIFQSFSVCIWKGLLVITPMWSANLVVYDTRLMVQIRGLGLWVWVGRFGAGNGLYRGAGNDCLNLNFRQNFP